MFPAATLSPTKLDIPCFKFGILARVVLGGCINFQWSRSPAPFRAPGQQPQTCSRQEINQQQFQKRAFEHSPPGILCPKPSKSRRYGKPDCKLIDPWPRASICSFCDLIRHSVLISSMSVIAYLRKSRPALESPAHCRSGPGVAEEQA